MEFNDDLHTYICENNLSENGIIEKPSETSIRSTDDHNRDKPLQIHDWVDVYLLNHKKFYPRNVTKYDEAKTIMQSIIMIGTVRIL